MNSLERKFEISLKLAEPIRMTRDIGSLRFGIGRLGERLDHLPDSIKTIYDLIDYNGKQILSDLNSKAKKYLKSIPAQVSSTGDHPILISNSAKIEHCFINTSDGPVCIDDDVLVMQGSMLRGPLYIGKGTVIKMGTALYSGTTIGDYCTVGGEIKNSIIDDFSNKAHNGYLGDSYIGRWCNLGAGTTVSNIKNTAGKIKVWDMSNSEFVEVNNKCGTVMGDHVKVAINTLFNSGSVVGPYSNVFDCMGTAPKFIPPLSWGTETKEKYKKEKLIEDIRKWMALKSKELGQDIIENINQLYPLN